MKYGKSTSQLDLKKITKKSSDIAKDVFNVINDELEKKKVDYDEQKTIREKQEQLKRLDVELVQKQKDIQSSIDYLDQLESRVGQIKDLMFNPNKIDPLSEMYDRRKRIEEEIILKLRLETELEYETELKEYLEKKLRPGIEKEQMERKLEQENQQRFFETIINSIQTEFPPEKILDEKELQSQLTIWLKRTLKDSKVEREQSTTNGVDIDILVDRLYAFEVKVPQSRTILRDLFGQLWEYKKSYPLLCAIIFNDQELNMLTSINEWTENYKNVLGVPTVIISGKRRKG